MPRGVYQRKAKDSPVVPSKGIETGNQEIVKHEVRMQHSNVNPGEKALDEPVYPKFDARPVNEEKDAMLKFFNDDLRIRIATNGDKYAEQIFEITVNGHTNLFRRGETKTVKRYIVDHMLRMKQTTFAQKELINDLGEKSIANIPTTSLKYDFSVEYDPHPRGREWLQATMMEP